MKNSILLLTGIFLITSCMNYSEEEKYSRNNAYAEKFSISILDSIRLLSLYNPWQGAHGESFQWILAGGKANIPDSMQMLKIIYTPVRKVAVFSTTHIGFINALNESNGIIGASGIQYLCDSVLREGSRNKELREIGYPPDINYELLLDINPDLVFLYGLDPGIAGIAARLERSGIPVIFIAEYLESHPLGKMEWIKVFGALYGKEKMADSIFESARTRYEELSSLAGSQANKPEILIGLPWKDTWYMSGGQSFTSRLIKDGGGKYLWEKDSSKEFIALTMESVLLKALNADFWINTGSATDLRDIEGRDSRFRQIKAFAKGNVYNNDAQVCDGGGNQFWEKGVVEPHIILEDLIKIFHPGMLDSDSLVYYRKMK